MDVLEQRMRAAGLPVGVLRARRAALPPAVQELHRQVLETIGRTGRPPAVGALEAVAPSLGVGLPGALDALDQAELLFLARTSRAVLGGVPFAAGPTVHQVTVVGGPTVSANCAIDALGIGAMLGRDTDLVSADPSSGQPVSATGREGRWTWQPAGAVVFVGSSGDGRITDACCPAINFFADEANALHHQRRHGLTCEVLTVPEAAEAAALVFGGLLAGPPP